MSIGRAIKSVRQARTLSQVELAKRTDLAQNVISRIENSDHKPNSNTMQKLCDALAIDKTALELMGILISAEDQKLNPLRQKMAPMIRKELEEVYGLNKVDPV